MYLCTSGCMDPSLLRLGGSTPYTRRCMRPQARTGASVGSRAGRLGAADWLRALGLQVSTAPRESSSIRPCTSRPVLTSRCRRISGGCCSTRALYHITSRPGHSAARPISTVTLTAPLTTCTHHSVDALDGQWPPNAAGFTSGLGGRCNEPTDSWSYHGRGQRAKAGIQLTWQCQHDNAPRGRECCAHSA